MDKRFSQHSLTQYGRLSHEDLSLIDMCRGKPNRLGFAYQLIFIRLLHRTPCQSPFELIDDIVVYAAMQLSLESSLIRLYGNRKKIAAHQRSLITYLNYIPFNEAAKEKIKEFIFQQALQFEPLSLLAIKSLTFLRELKVLLPAEDTLLRLIRTQRAAARQSLFDQIHTLLSPEIRRSLDALLEVKEGSSILEKIKVPVKKASPEALLNLSDRCQWIKATGALKIDLSCVNNNYQRTLANEIKRCSVDRIRKMEPTRRSTAMICFLQQAYALHIDVFVSSYIKVITGAYTRSSNQIDKQIKQYEEQMRESLTHYEAMKETIRDPAIPDDQLRPVLYEKFPDELAQTLSDSHPLLKRKKEQIFEAFTNRYAYFRQFTPAFFKLVELQGDSTNKITSSTLEAFTLLKKWTQDSCRDLPKNLPLDFVPAPLKKAVCPQKGEVSRAAWECALYLKVKDEIKQGNINVPESKRFASLRSFLISPEEEKDTLKEFFKRSGFPEDPAQVKDYFTQRLAAAYKTYLQEEPENDYAKVIEGKWVIKSDSADVLTPEEKEDLKKIKSWIAKKMPLTKLPEVLIDVDNEVHFTQALIPPTVQEEVSVDNIFGVLAAIMAHGCNIGLYTMSQLVEGISYKEMYRITDWQLTNDGMRVALSWIVNALSKIGITKKWGTGKTSSSDAHLKPFHQKVSQQSYHSPLGDFALAFYTFVADNYAPFHSKPFECGEGEAPHALDGYLYNESDLPLEEHYTDTRAAATVMFGAFAWYGQKYSPRIRGLKNHHIYYIDPEGDYGSLSCLLKHKESQINMECLTEHWVEMARFYASIEQGKATASVALRRLLSLSKKNAFYKATLYLGRILKTEHILAHMSNRDYRKRKHRGLLKGEEVHQLARNINYANRGKITARDIENQVTTCNCLTLIMGCVIYWQAHQLDQLTQTKEFAEQGFDSALLQHISPVGWDNIVLYGEYVINKDLIKR